MRSAKIIMPAAIIAGALVLGGGAGFVGTMMGSAPAAAEVQPADTPEIALPPVKTNQVGETYGALPLDPMNESSPDLIAVLLEDGTTGYVRSSEFLKLTLPPQEVTSPAEARKWQLEEDANSRAKGSSVKELPVYDSSGKLTGQSWYGINNDG